MCVESRVHLVGASISIEKNFYRLSFTPPLSGSPYRSFIWDHTLPRDQQVRTSIATVAISSLANDRSDPARSGRKKKGDLARAGEKEARAGHGRSRGACQASRARESVVVAAKKQMQIAIAKGGRAYICARGRDGTRARESVVVAAKKQMQIAIAKGGRAYICARGRDGWQLAIDAKLF
jgi:hypothetical protein